MTGYVLSGIETNEYGDCPLYHKAFRQSDDAINYAKNIFHLSGWRERATGFWEIQQRDRRYTIEKMEVDENDIAMLP